MSVTETGPLRRRLVGEPRTAGGSTIRMSATGSKLFRNGDRRSDSSSTLHKRTRKARAGDDTYVAETRPGDVVLHWMKDGRRIHPVVDRRWPGRVGPDHLARTRDTRKTAASRGLSEAWAPGPLRDFHELEHGSVSAIWPSIGTKFARVHAALEARYGKPLYLALSLYNPPRGVEVGTGLHLQMAVGTQRRVRQPSRTGPAHPGRAPGFGSTASTGKPRGAKETATRATPPQGCGAPRDGGGDELVRRAGLHGRGRGDTKSWDIEARRGNELRRSRSRARPGFARPSISQRTKFGTPRLGSQPICSSSTASSLTTTVELSERAEVVYDGGRSGRQPSMRSSPTTYSYLLAPAPQQVEAPASITYVAPAEPSASAAPKCLVE